VPASADADAISRADSNVAFIVIIFNAAQIIVAREKVPGNKGSKVQRV
jgi:hypothetical protein